MSQGDKQRFADEFNVSRETLERFEIYEAQLRKWAPKINLISMSTIDEIWSRHFHNSAMIMRHLNEDTKDLIDFGTGAGFPGLVAAILISQNNVKSDICLVDENYKRISFLRETARAMNLSINAIHGKVEEVVPRKFDVLTARAFAPLDKLLDLSHTYAQLGARLLFLKGKDVKNEIETAKIKWEFDFKIDIFDEKSGSCILEISELKRETN